MENFLQAGASLFFTHLVVQFLIIQRIKPEKRFSYLMGNCLCVWIVSTVINPSRILVSAIAYLFSTLLLVIVNEFQLPKTERKGGNSSDSLHETDSSKRELERQERLRFRQAELYALQLKRENDKKEALLSALEEIEYQSVDIP